MLKPIFFPTLLAAAVSAQVHAGYSLVYTQQPRISDRLANWQHWYDGGLDWRHTEGDLVQDFLDGTKKVWVNCTGDAKRICSAQDARVSPDGTRVMYTLAEGTQLYAVKEWDGPLMTPAIEFGGPTVSYSLHVLDLVTGKDVVITTGARQGDWFNDTSIVYTAYTNINTPWAYSGPEAGYVYKVRHVFISDLTVDYKLSATLDLSPESVGAMSPAVFPDGRVCWSDYNGFGQRAVGHTPSNMVWVKCANGDGTDSRYLLGAHGSPAFKTAAYMEGIVDPNRRGEGATTLKLLRGIVPLRGDEYAIESYYRSNHRGKRGMILIGKRLPGDTEGYSRNSALHAATQWSTSVLDGSGMYNPDYEIVTPWAMDQDQNSPKFHLNGRAMGKGGDAAPSPLSEGPLIYTWSRGASYEGIVPALATREAMGGEPTSKDQIMQVLPGVRQVLDPFNPKYSRVLACADETINCFDARYVATYMDLHGVEPPVRPSILTGKVTILQIVNARAGEFAPRPGGTEQDKIAFQGNFVDGWQQKIAAIRIWKITQWTTQPTRLGFADRQIYKDYPLLTDGSVRAIMQCDMVYQLQGIDAVGNVVASDETTHYARCGEVVTCHGCHDGHSWERVKQYVKSAVERFNSTLAAAAEKLPGGC